MCHCKQVNVCARLTCHVCARLTCLETFLPPGIRIIKQVRVGISAGFSGSLYQKSIDDSASAMLLPAKVFVEVQSKSAKVTMHRDGVAPDPTQSRGSWANPLILPGIVSCCGNLTAAASTQGQCSPGHGELHGSFRTEPHHHHRHQRWLELGLPVSSQHA